MKWKTERAVKTNPVKSQRSHILFETHGWWKSALVHLMGSTCRSVESFNLFISLQTPSKCDTKQAVNWSVQHCITLPIQITPYMLQWAVSQQPQENIPNFRRGWCDYKLYQGVLSYLFFLTPPTALAFSFSCFLAVTNSSLVLTSPSKTLRSKSLKLTASLSSSAKPSKFSLVNWFFLLQRLDSSR